jgi:hypothetical protein
MKIKLKKKYPEQMRQQAFRHVSFSQQVCFSSPHIPPISPVAALPPSTIEKK